LIVFQVFDENAGPESLMEVQAARVLSIQARRHLRAVPVWGRPLSASSAAHRTDHWARPKPDRAPAKPGAFRGNPNTSGRPAVGDVLLQEIRILCHRGADNAQIDTFHQKYFKKIMSCSDVMKSKSPDEAAP